MADKASMNLFQKISEARVRLGDADIDKSGWNAHAKFKYFLLDDFMPTARKICRDLGILPIESFEEKKAVMIVYDADDMSSNVRFECPCETPTIPGANTTQAIGGMITYLRRYLWMILFEITEDDEFDSDGEGKDEPQRPQAQRSTVSPNSAPPKDTRPAEAPFDPKKTWNAVVKFYGYDTSKPSEDKDNQDAIKAAHEFFDPYAKSLKELTREKSDAIMSRLKVLSEQRGPEDFQDDSLPLMEEGA